MSTFFVIIIVFTTFFFFFDTGHRVEKYVIITLTGFFFSLTAVNCKLLRRHFELYFLLLPLRNIDISKCNSDEQERGNKGNVLSHTRLTVFFDIIF